MSFAIQPTAMALDRPHQPLAALAVPLLVSGVGVLVASPLLVVGAPVAWAMIRHRAVVAQRRAASRRLADELPAAVDQLIHHLEAGRSLGEALRLLGPASEPVDDRPGSALAETLAPMRAGLRAGLGLRASLARLGPDLPPGPDLLVNTLTVLVDRGGPALPSLERLNDTLRSARWVQLEAQTQAGQATASAMALAALPAVFAGGLAALDGRLARFYLFDPAGTACLVIAAVLAYLGWWWMQTLIEAAR